MKDKLLKHLKIKKKPHRSLVKVCAWCPKKYYPALKQGQEYTHGMCKKHYKELSINKDLPMSFHIAEFIETTWNNFGEDKIRLYSSISLRSKKYLKQLKKALKAQTKQQVLPTES